MIEFLQQTVNGFVIGSSYVLIALGLTLIFGMLDMINFAHGELLMVGAFIAVGLASGLGLPYLLAIPLAMLIVGVLGVVMERLAFKPLRNSDRVNLMVSSLGVSIILQNAVQLIWGPDPRNLQSPFTNMQIHLGGMVLNGQRLFVVFVAALLIGVLYYVIQKTKIGIAMRACAFDMETAKLMGIKANRIIIMTFAIGAGLAASAGTLLAPIFSVYPTMGVMATMKAFVVVLLGGIGNVTGAIAGGLILGLVETYAAGYWSSEYKDVISFVIMILVLLFKPAGLFGKHVQEKV
ncbi:branched-chain amino acid ABC transporter permease [Effusibacillus lacus]|uniref:Branched-chain amino acid ABC transporter permease n=1 Tax=Effusibacillus lacus TaxID=1348429 RepID=A0A292YNW0_9BACL|nr:branched-chain amino acid ABC transporter permease [Effusibacillus lacus]TCS72565.1 amino acid/amide ABC transporter membrane protein 1 (HAAT family) [Effusibacillus lacus]GAX90876.1 branched-chain amino acid ABC transporter permease [Effusibacillus lacus]